MLPELLSSRRVSLSLTNDLCSARGKSNNQWIVLPKLTPYESLFVAVRDLLPFDDDNAQACSLERPYRYCVLSDFLRRPAECLLEFQIN